MNLKKSKQIVYLGEALKMSPSISILSHKHLTILRLQEIKDMIVLKHLIRGNSNGCPDGFGTVKDSLHGHDEQARMILKPLHQNFKS